MDPLLPLLLRKAPPDQLAAEFQSLADRCADRADADEQRARFGWTAVLFVAMVAWVLLALLAAFAPVTSLLRLAQ